ncbi:hypothetical protein [Peribacillus frigoritolerans]|uniref:hypothetical protein n=1 Tax=Peribacillus frigoritolerans TaxID=450367 RepID=UPI00107086D9|nr:hypothetical protein [Peribacillus frigoritolerans]TFH60014.1 hypothetical protein E4J71_16560 [Peribacillus frigoritolerans]
MFFPVIVNVWKKYATLLPKDWLAETPETLASRRLGRQSAERGRTGFLKSTGMSFRKKLHVKLYSLNRNPFVDFGYFFWFCY